MKGRQEWITEDGDIKNMFDVHCKKKEILIWCFLPVDKKKRNAKRSKSEDTSHKKSKNSSTEDDNDVDDVATLVQTLKQNMEMLSVLNNIMGGLN